MTESVIAKEVTGMRAGISHKQSTGIFNNIRDFVVCSRMSSCSDAFSDSAALTWMRLLISPRESGGWVIPISAFERVMSFEIVNCDVQRLHHIIHVCLPAIINDSPEF